MYLYLLLFLYCLAYFALFFGIPFFFTARFPKIRSIRSIAYIIAFYIAVMFIESLIPDRVLANRFLHTFGGGFLVVLVCFLAIKDSNTTVNKFQFFIISISMAALFGTANEILEFILQNLLGLTAAYTINDTWLDLISNTIGSIIGVIALMPFKKA